MSYSYSAPLTYNSSALTYENNNQQQVHVSRNAGPAVGGFIIGAAAGSYAGFRKVPYFNGKNDVKDTFAKNAHRKYLKNAAEETERKTYSQLKTVTDKIKRVKDVDSLHNLMNANPLAKEAISEDLLKEAADINLPGTKSTIKTSLLAKQKESLQGMKNRILNCWDPEAKKFVKPEDMGEQTFRAIKKAARRIKYSAIAKYSIITGAITAIAATVINNVIKAKKNISK